MLGAVCIVLLQLLLMEHVQKEKDASFKNLQPVTIQGNLIKWQLCEKPVYTSAVLAKCSSRLKVSFSFSLNSLSEVGQLHAILKTTCCATARAYGSNIA